jgi:hypothetical protein
MISQSQPGAKGPDDRTGRQRRWSGPEGSVPRALALRCATPSSVAFVSLQSGFRLLIEMPRFWRAR